MSRASLLFVFFLLGCCDDVHVPYATVDLGAIRTSQATQGPAPAQAEPVAEAAKLKKEDFELLVYSSRLCGPCQTWKAKEKPNVGIKMDINEFKTLSGPSWLKSWPTFVLRRRDGDKWVEEKVWTGYTSAKVINDEVDKLCK